MKLFFYGDYIQCEVADNDVVFFGGCRNGVLWVEVIRYDTREEFSVDSKAEYTA